MLKWKWHHLLINLRANQRQQPPTSEQRQYTNKGHASHHSSNQKCREREREGEREREEEKNLTLITQYTERSKQQPKKLHFTNTKGKNEIQRIHHHHHHHHHHHQNEIQFDSQIKPKTHCLTK